MDNRKIDAAIAEKVFNWELMEGTSMVKNGHLTYRYIYPNRQWDWVETLVPKFSTDIAAAWLVAEKINSIKMDTEEDYQIKAKFVLNSGVKNLVTFSAQQAALNICLAALQAVGIEVEGD